MQHGPGQREPYFLHRIRAGLVREPLIVNASPLATLPGVVVVGPGNLPIAVEHSYEAGHSSILRLRGYDLLHRLRKRRPVRVHIETTVAELAVELTRDPGLVVKSENAWRLLKRSLQHRHTDLEVLRGALEACGLYTTLRGDVLHIIGLTGMGAPETLTLGKDLLEAHFSVNGDSACRSV